MSSTYILIVIGLLFLLTFIAWYIIVINKINVALIKIEEANSGIDVALTQRYDVLTKMIDVVKAYTKHEKETLFEVVNIRNNMKIEEKSEINNKMNNNFEQIKIIAENYPELRSNENYKTLQLSINEVENNLQTARKVYNSNVSNYNKIIVTFPNSIAAKLKGMKQKEFFEANEEKKNDVKINL